MPTRRQSEYSTGAEFSKCCLPGEGQPRPSSRVASPAAVDVLVAAAALGRRPLHEVVAILGDDLAEAAVRLARQTALPASYFSASFVPSTALSLEQIRAWAFQTLAARGADGAAVTDMVVRVVADRTLDDVARSVCTTPRRLGRAYADVLRDLIAAVNAAASFPPGFVNERLIVSSCLPTQSLRGVVQMALVGPEVRAEDGCYADLEARDRDVNRQRSTSPARPTTPSGRSIDRSRPY